MKRLQLMLRRYFMADGSRFIVYGAGAIGSVIGGMLAESGHEVALVGRAAHMEGIRSDGLRITGLLGEHTVTSLAACAALADLPQRQPPDFILVSVKSNDTAAAGRELERSGLVGDNTKVVSLQNGLGNVEELAARFGTRRVLGGRVIFGAEISAPGNVLVSVWADEVLLGGEDMESAARLAAIFTNAGIDTGAHPHIQAALWGKVLYNVGLNPLSAILEVPYGELGIQPDARELLIKLIREAFEVASAETVLPWKDDDEYLGLFFEKLLPATVAHRSSMLQDMERGRQTEIEAINGEVVRRARSRAIKVPANETVYSLVRSKTGLDRP
jgi:2-dehydropantoate 2-reductase